MDNARGGQDQALESDLRPPTGPEPLAARRRVGILFAVAALVYVLDVVTKLLVVSRLTLGQPVHVIGSLLQLTYTRNSGAAFSIGWSYTAIFSLIAIGVVFVILRLARNLYSGPWAVALGLLLGGAAGNLTDRIARAPGPFRGWVVDFVQLPHFAIFNLADAAITCGGVLMVLLAFRGLHPDGTDERAAAERAAAEAEAQTGSEAPAEASESGESDESAEREHEHR
ncbi:signal peptidase II [Actinospica robiniae]|uniref:signal peptidase II n=1 Tax=Actinospica robiniae TaxID=304901 RepID=UPI0004000E8B|nr:signal peptidase II [Actinospica robiniae]